ncbi:hypothetical protein [Peredibacter starrii]|uniref:Uncharacterized protein n=1 Tax=Peredibacter starrii TaxID=28202 RepID=A0AAX4HLE1_9BACT|nr:hypothetical protein [Peredibacter starrii]WPU64046.1 hypothetical protein SOO65_15220 [Peredibacter starrii]
MSLPVYQHINLKTGSLDELNAILNQELNLKHPVTIGLKALDLDQQRELIGLIENYFVSHNLSYKFPYPVYLISDHEASITKVPLVKKQDELPKFFTQRDSKMNVKESHLAGKNKLLQQEVRNSDASSNTKDAQNYGEAHRIIYELEEERKFYRLILNRLVKGKK